MKEGVYKEGRGKEGMGERVGGGWAGMGRKGSSGVRGEGGVPVRATSRLEGRGARSLSRDTGWPSSIKYQKSTVFNDFLCPYLFMVPPDTGRNLGLQGAHGLRPAGGRRCDGLQQAVL